MKKLKKSIFKNVFPYKYASGKLAWVAKVRYKGRTIHIGTFPYTDDGEEQAANEAAKYKRHIRINERVSELIQAIKDDRITIENLHALRANLMDKFEDMPATSFTPELIITACCSYYSVTKEELMSRTRVRAVANVRAAVCYFMHIYKHTFSSIARTLKIDHTSAMYHFRQIRDRLTVDTDLAIDISTITHKIEIKHEKGIVDKLKKAS